MFKQRIVPSLLIFIGTIGTTIFVLPTSGDSTKNNHPDYYSANNITHQGVLQQSSSPPHLQYFPIYRGINPKVGLWQTVPFTDCPRITFTIVDNSSYFILEDIGLWNNDCQMLIDPNGEESPYYDDCKVSYLRFRNHSRIIDYCVWDAYKGTRYLLGLFTSPSHAEGIHYHVQCVLEICTTSDTFNWTAEYIPQP